MKKTLLSLSLLAVALTAAADTFDSFFYATFNGEEVKNGATLILNDDQPGNEENTLTYFNSHILVESYTVEPTFFYGALFYQTPATATEVNTDYKWGLPAFCFSGGAVMTVPDGGGTTSPGTCLAGGSEYIVGSGYMGCPAEDEGILSIEPHLEDAAADVISTYRLVLQPTQYNEDEQEWENFCDPLEVYLQFTPKGMSGVETVEAADANAPVEYFDLQGRSIANPEKGLYIKRQGASVEKVVLL